MPLKATRVVALPGPDKTVNVLARTFRGTQLEVGGWFERVGDKPAMRIATWTDGDWRTYSAIDPNLHVGQSRLEMPVVEDICRTSAEGNAALLYGTWNGLVTGREGKWQRVAGHSRDTRALCRTDDNRVYVGTRDDTQRCCGRVLRYFPASAGQAERLEQVGADFPLVRSSFVEATSTVRALLSVKEGKRRRLFAGNASGVYFSDSGAADTIWTKIGGETPPIGGEDSKPEYVRSLAYFYGSLFAAGHYGVKRWHEDGWRKLPFVHGADEWRLSSRVRKLLFEDREYLFAVFMPDLGSDSMVCVLEGEKWRELVLLKGQANDVSIYEDALFVGGRFTEANGVECQNLCRVDLEWTR